MLYVVFGFRQLSVEARGAMVEVLVAEYNCSYICGQEWCRRQGERHRWRVEVWWPGRGSLVVMGEGIAGEVEGWREQVRAGQHLLLTEDLVALLRGAGWGGGKSRQGRQRGARRERKRWELDEGMMVVCLARRALRCWRIRSSALGRFPLWRGRRLLRKPSSAPC